MEVPGEALVISDWKLELHLDFLHAVATPGPKNKHGLRNNRSVSIYKSQPPSATKLDQ